MPSMAEEEKHPTTHPQNGRDSDGKAVSRQSSRRSANDSPHTPPAEWAVAGLGLVLVLGAVGYQLYEGVTSKSLPPAIVLKQTEIRKSADGYVVEFEVQNAGDQTVAGLLVEGELRQPDTAPETCETTFDYVPRGSKSRGGLFFEGNPRQGTFTLRAKGYQEP
jgi:uncharacterized protein (TIGR02588 family)